MIIMISSVAIHMSDIHSGIITYITRKIKKIEPPTVRYIQTYVHMYNMCVRVCVCVKYMRVHVIFLKRDYFTRKICKPIYNREH